MRSLVFINYFNKPSETFIRDQVDFLVNSGIDLEVLGHASSSTKEKAINMPSNLLKRIGGLKFNNFSDILFLLKSFKYRNGLNLVLFYFRYYFISKNYDLIYAHFGQNGKIISQLIELEVISKITKLVVHFHGMDLNEEKYGKKYYNLLNKYADLLLVGSKFGESQLLKFNLKKAKIMVFPLGVDVSRINGIGKKKNDKSINEIKIISVGRLVPFKGHLFCLDVIAEFKKKSNKKINYTIIGEGELKNELLKKIKDLGIEGEVSLLGVKNHQETVKIIKSHDIYLYGGIRDHEGRVEMQGIANLEAMGCGLIVLASEIGGVPDYIQDSVNGYLCKPQDLNCFVEKLIFITNNLSKLDHVRSNAVQKVEKEYSQEEKYIFFKNLFLGNYFDK